VRRPRARNRLCRFKSGARNCLDLLLHSTLRPGTPLRPFRSKAFLQAQVNKSDRNDARGIAQMMRVNLFRPVHVKTLTSQRRRALLTARKLLQGKALAVDNDIRGLLRNFGLKVGPIGASKFEARIRELVEGMRELAEIIDPLLEARRKLRERFAVLHRKLLAIVRDDTVCRRLMTVPGIGPVVSIAFTATIDVPAHFKSSKAVGAALGLTPVLNQSGESKRLGRVSPVTALPTSTCLALPAAVPTQYETHIFYSVAFGRQRQ
jgi:transposase